VDLEATISSDHPARSPRAFIEGLDIPALYGAIVWVEGRAVRAAMDAKIVLSLAGGGSEQLTEAHDAYLWICGGVKVNHRTLSDSCSPRMDLFDDWPTHSVAVLKERDLDSASTWNAHATSCAD